MQCTTGVRSASERTKIKMNDIVISGMSGRLPECNSIEEFAKNLFEGVDMVTADDRRWTPGLHGLPDRNGTLKDVVHFDAAFFGVHVKQAHMMDPQLRLLLETTHEAIIDAGINPVELRGSRTGCYVGVSKSETEEIWASDHPDKINGYAHTGCLRAMLPNRISYTFDFKGPSYAIDTGCSSSSSALVQATAAIKMGHCDAAIIAGTNLCLAPATSLNFHRLGMLSEEGRCAAFDASGSDYVRSEAVVAILLQRRADARRIYATVRGARMNNDGYKMQGITFPNGVMQHQLAAETFEEACLRPQDCIYIEAHGTGTQVGDPQEVNAIANFFCKDRKTPLLLGSVKSNMGHSESAAGLCSIVKLMIAMERGIIPGNLHYKTPKSEIPALSDGRIKVVDRNTPWDGGVVAINSFGFGGANAHVILQSGPSTLRPSHAGYSLPRLVLASGRTENAVQALLDHATVHATDAGLHSLLDAVHAQHIPGHAYRGYTLIGVAPVIEEIMEVERTEPPPVWFVFSGMGSQSPHTVRALMQVPMFATSVHRSATTLRPHGVDLLHLLNDASNSSLADVISSYVYIVAIQIALVDVMRTVGIHPDGIIGMSVGELGCAYADEALTAEQTILAAYWRGRSILDAKLPAGAMASIAMTWEECMVRCPPDIALACHNSEHNVTVAGPESSIESFVAKLTTEGVFARRVQSCGVAFHSKYIEAAAPLLRDRLETLIPCPRRRTARWISSSLPKDQWNSDMAKLSDAEYHVNNFLSPVWLAEALRSVPKRALLVEMAPRAMLQTILRHTPLASSVYVPLMHRESSNAMLHLLAALGKIYCAGAQPQPGALYPEVAWPVPRGTAGLASHVVWDHSVEWSVASVNSSTTSSENIIEFDLSKSADAYLAGHEIDGRITFPATGYITMVWRTVAKLYKKELEETAIVMNDLQFKRATIVSKDTPVRFLVNVLENTGEFNVCEGGSVVATGKVRFAENPDTGMLHMDMPTIVTGPGMLPLNANDMYKEFSLRGYNYSGVFRGIQSADALINVGELSWIGNWISFIDTILQFDVFSKYTKGLRLPTYMQRVVINPMVHLAAICKADTINVRRYNDIDLTTSGGIEFHGVTMSLAPRRLHSHSPPKLEKYVFLPYVTMNINTKDLPRSKGDALTVSLQIILENVDSSHLKIMEEALDRPVEALLISHVLQLLEDEPQVQVESSLFVTSITPAYTAAMQKLDVKVSVRNVNISTDSSYHLVLAANVLMRDSERMLLKLTASLADNGMLLLEEHNDVTEQCVIDQVLERVGLMLVSRQVISDCQYLLLKLRPTVPTEHVVLQIDDDQFRWVELLRTAIKRAETDSIRIYVVTQSSTNGILGLIACLRHEPGGHAVRVFFLSEASEPFSLTAPVYVTQLRKDLAVNVLRAGVWGSYRHLQLGDISGAELQDVCNVEHAYVNTLVCGDLSSLRWIESPLALVSEQQQRSEQTELVHVYYASLNFRDVMLATGKLSPDALPGNLADQECILGLEFSGRLSSGKRVMGMVPARGLATTVIANKEFLWEVPDAWTLEEAATVPVVYLTAYYALVVRGRMKHGETVLVHAGAGGVGQAAIAIALDVGCKVFTTVSTPDKRAFLRERFPALNDAWIGNSRDTSFEQMVRCCTRGRGVDLVLSSLAGDQLLASVRCLAEGGRFLEIGKLDLSNNTALGMAIFLKNTTFHGILLDALFDAEDNNADKTAVLRCMADGLANGAVKPLPFTVFLETQLEELFRYMASGKDIGKVLLRIREEEASRIVRPNTKLVSALRRTYFHPDKSYVLVGGLGGFGLELSHWLVKRGATRLVFNSRSGIRTGYQARCLRNWREAGVRIVLSTSDVTTIDGANVLLREAAALGPIGGIFNLAVVLRDAFFENQTAADFMIVAKPKANSTKALDAASRQLAPILDYFVVFSSVSCGRGNPGQSNYGFANSVMERICELRQADGLAGLAVQWGPIGEVGLLETTGHDKAVMGGMVPQRIASCMRALDMLLGLPHAVTSCIVVAEKHRSDVQSEQNVVQAVANILGIKNPLKTPDSTSLAELGMDSLMCAEIKQILEHSYGLILSMHEIRMLTFAKLRNATGDSPKVLPQKSSEGAC